MTNSRNPIWRMEKAGQCIPRFVGAREPVQAGARSLSHACSPTPVSISIAPRPVRFGQRITPGLPSTLDRAASGAFRPGPTNRPDLRGI